MSHVSCYLVPLFIEWEKLRLWPFINAENSVHGCHFYHHCIHCISPLPHSALISTIIISTVLGQFSRNPWKKAFLKGVNVCGIGKTGPGGKTTSDETCVGALVYFCDKTLTEAPLEGRVYFGKWFRGCIPWWWRRPGGRNVRSHCIHS